MINQSFLCNETITKLRTGGVAQAIEYLLCKQLQSHPPQKKKKRQKEKELGVEKVMRVGPHGCNSAFIRRDPS
jgi:hypothetical protein